MGSFFAGHHTFPLLPRFPDQEKFKGRIIHTHDYRRPQGFENHRVTVVGVGNSGGDAAVELSTIADQVGLHLSIYIRPTRSGDVGRRISTKYDRSCRNPQGRHIWNALGCSGSALAVGDTGPGWHQGLALPSPLRDYP